MMKKFNVGIKGVVRREDGAVLLLQKNKGEGAFWEMPGGRIDEDETVEQTLERELQEELPGIKNVVVGKALTAHRLPFDIGDDLGLMLVYFEVKAVLPDPVRFSGEHQAYKWVNNITDVQVDQGTLKALNATFNR